MRTEWTVTRADQQQLARGLWLDLLLGRLGVLLCVYLVLILWGIWAGIGIFMAIIVGIGAGVVCAILGLRVRRTVQAMYPVEFTATSETSAAGIRISNAVAASEVPWQNLVQPRQRGAVVAVWLPRKCQRICIPRALLPEDALTRLGLSTDSDSPDMSTKKQ